MTIAGVPWADIREAGRLDRLYREISWAHRGATGALSAGDRSLLVVPVLLRWAAVALLVGMAFDGDSSVGAREGLLALGAAFLSLPLLRLSRSAHLDSFEALRAPSREALLLARWVDLAPTALVAGVAWAAYLGSRLQSVDALPTRDVGVVLACVALLPFRLATVGAWKKVEDKRLDDRPSAFLRCLLYGGMIAALTISRVSESGASVYSAVAPGLVALVFLGLAGFHVAGFAKRGAGTVGSWGRGLLLVLLAECAGLAFVLAIGALWIDPTLLRGEVVPHFAGWLALLALAAVPVTGIVAAALALRDIGSAEIRSLAMDRGGRPTETALAEERSEAKSATGKAEPIGPGRTPRRGAWAAHAGWWKDGLDRTSLLLSTIWGAVLLMALNVGVILEPIRAAWVLIPVTFLIPRRVTVDHRSRAYLLGMDLRDQARHDLRALLLFAVAPAFLFCAGTLALVGWRDDQAPALTLLASVFLVRAGWPGLRLAGMRMATAVAVLGSASGLAARPDPIWVCAAAALLAALGIMGLIHLLTRTEDDLRADMRILGT